MNKGIQNIFSPIPQTYELINHILTLGFDAPVRRYAAKFAVANNDSNQDIQKASPCHCERPQGAWQSLSPERTGLLRRSTPRNDTSGISYNTNKRWLDVCTGTGEMAHCLSKYAKENTLIMASDFTLPMLRYARQGRNSPVRFTAADSIRLPFRNNTFDLVTISFATRNINISYQNLLACLKEFRRVLKPGGRFINLETSQPPLIALQKLLHSFVKIFVRPIGSAISGSQSAYTYLSQTIPRFYDADRFSDIILEAGFKECKYRHILGGLAAIHQGINK